MTISGLQSGSTDTPHTLPVLASTSFCMDVLLQGSVLDLASLREVLTFDPCALLRLFQQAAWSSPDSQDGPQTLDECIVQLGALGLRRALTPSASSWQEQARLQAFAEHSTAVGRAAQILAGALSLCEETAFLTGAFHELGSLGLVLDANASSLQSTTLKKAEDLCTLYRLPAPLREAILAVHHTEPAFPWGFVLQAAHELAEADAR